MSTRLLQTRPDAQLAATADFTPVRSGMLQHKCACGGTPGPDGECAECRKKRLQRRSTGQAEPSTVPPIVNDVLRSPGQPLDLATRTFMEPRFGHDFGRVRVHTDTRAAESARAVNALAYTVGRNVVFEAGQYTPGTSGGQKLLAHELTHVVQQDAGRASIQRQAAGRSPQGRTAGESAAAPAAESSCLEPVAGEPIPSLLQAGAVTVIEFGAEWCKPCHYLQAVLEEICRGYRDQPQSVPVRFYTVAQEAEGNEEIHQEYAQGGLPHLYIYVGSAQKHHSVGFKGPEFYEQVVTEQVGYAMTSGATRGAKSGMMWGSILGLIGGLGGAIALAAGVGGLTGNALMLGMLGTVAGGALAGLGLGAGIGAIIGALTDDRNRGPRTQRRRRLQPSKARPKLRSGRIDDPYEREADQMADWIIGQPPAASPSPIGTPEEDVLARLMDGAAQPLEIATRDFMEPRFGQDFSHVRVHRDAEAAQIAKGMDAFAVTSGADIYFAPDAYAPDTFRGRAILAHELAHVVQNERATPEASVANLETEAAQVGVNVIAGRAVGIRHASRHPALAITRGEQTALWAGIGAVGLGVLGALAGGLVGGLIGAAVGGLGGALLGRLTYSPEFVETNEAEFLIQRTFGRYLPGGTTAPLHNARVRPVRQAELCEWFECRHPGDKRCDSTWVGWTDQGPQPQDLTRPQAGKPPSGKCLQLEPATYDRPVIYYATDHRDAFVLIHEGLHAHAHPKFGLDLGDYVNEGATEYFTRQILDEIKMPSVSGHTEKVADLKKLMDKVGVGEETLRRAFFQGEIEKLHQTADKVLGPCGLYKWAFEKAGGWHLTAEAVIEGPPRNYCAPGKTLPDVAPPHHWRQPEPIGPQKGGE